MPGVKNPPELAPYIAYEHRKANGELVSRGRQFLDRQRRMHFRQDDAKGRRIGEVIFAKDGSIVETIVGESAARSQFRELVGYLKSTGHAVKK